MRVAVEAIPVSGVSELVLEVLDLDAAERFYADTLGWPVVERWPEREAIWVMAGRGTRIGLWRPQVGVARSRGGIHVHFALQIDEADYEPAIAALRERRLDIHEERFGDGRGRAAFVADPDGNVVEFWTWDVAGHLDELGERS
jgi:catechol 2,3-dioxygenase-like lactoylglutathione lyase family enzyme